MTREEKVAAILKAVIEDSSADTAAIAQRTGVDERTVDRVTAMLEANRLSETSGNRWGVYMDDETGEIDAMYEPGIGYTLLADYEPGVLEWLDLDAQEPGERFDEALDWYFWDYVEKYAETLAEIEADLDA